MDGRRLAELHGPRLQQGLGGFATRGYARTKHELHAFRDQIVRQLDRDARIRLIVEVDEVHRPAFDAALLVDHAFEQRQRRLHALARKRALSRQRQHRRDVDRHRLRQRHRRQCSQ